MNSTSILSIIAVFAMLVGTVATVSNAFADNSADQSQEFSQDSEQNSLCVSGDDTSVSCNNLSGQLQLNFGNNALGQDDSDEE
jgi:hypothetical protein